jgi:8-amino-7-oxononanoate synthase
MSWDQRLARAAAGREAQQRRRSIAATRYLGAVVIERGGRELVDFSSNDYLGLARNPEQAAVLAAAARAHGAGAGAAHAVSGHHPEHDRLQAELADWLQRDAVLLCSSGWSAALGTLAGLLGRHDRCVQDRLNHACLLDGARLAGARLQRHAHADPKDAARLLAEPAAATALTLLVSDGVFSMDGDVAPLAELAALAARVDGWLMVDEAHALGVLGPQGQGSSAAAGLGQAEVQILMGTFGKAFGAWGAFIAGSSALIEHLQHSARPWLYSTALPPAWATLCRAALQRLRYDDSPRELLQQRIEQFRGRAMQAGLALLPSTTAIQPLLLGNEARALAWEAALLEAGLLVKAIRPPTVPVGASRLRICLSACHQPAQVDALLEALVRIRDGEAASARQHE